MDFAAWPHVSHCPLRASHSSPEMRELAEAPWDAPCSFWPLVTHGPVCHLETRRWQEGWEVTSPYTPGPGHTRTPLWLWTGARPGTEHPSVSAPASVCTLFLLSVSCSHSFSFHLSYRSVFLFPGQPSGFSHYVTLGMHFPVYLFPSLSLLIVICLQHYASDPWATSGDVAPLSPHLRKLLGTPDLMKPREIQVLKGCFRH